MYYHWWLDLNKISSICLHPTAIMHLRRWKGCIILLFRHKRLVMRYKHQICLPPLDNVHWFENCREVLNHKKSIQNQCNQRMRVLWQRTMKSMERHCVGHVERTMHLMTSSGLVVTFVRGGFMGNVWGLPLRRLRVSSSTNVHLAATREFVNSSFYFIYFRFILGTSIECKLCFMTAYMFTSTSSRLY